MFDNVEAIYTYDNPFKIDRADYWGKIKELPHLCASQTLVQGMSYIYNDIDYTTPFFAIDDFIRLYYEGWEADVENKIKQYCDISNYISNLPDSKLKYSFKFNKNKLFDSLRLLKELGVSPNNFNYDELNNEQNNLIKFYDDLHNNQNWNLINQHEETFIVLEKLLNDKADYFKDSIKQNRNSTSRYKRIMKQKHIQSKQFINKLNRPGAVVINGVHRFNSLTTRLLEDLEEEGVKVYFLINYKNDFKRIYSTWDKVYSWCDKEFIEHRTDYKGNKLGLMIGNLLEGNSVSNVSDLDYNNYSFKVYENLTTFSDEIKASFECARKSLSQEKNETRKPKEIFGSEVLGRMNNQYYAPDNEKINGLLKSYFPEQFGDKPFLSYPIGQLILNLYNMWNEEKQCIEIDNNSLKECIYYFSRIDNGLNPLLTYEKMELYVQNVNKKSLFLSKIDELIKTNLEVENKDNNNLEMFSFYNISEDELNHLREIIKLIFRVMGIIFKVNKDGLINFKEHYKDLASIINSESIQKYLNEKEEQIVEDILMKLDSSDELDYDGYISDLKESLHFYLSSKRKEDPHWIVRNLEQLDGDVLLSKNNTSKDSRIYHLSLISDSNMNYSINNLLPWPLSENFFQAYTGDLDIHRKINMILEPLREYSNFLRFSLFYASYYTNNSINISYVESYQDEKQNPYFLLDMLGIRFKEIEQLIDNEQNNKSSLFNYNENFYNTNDFIMDEKDFQYGLLCPLRFFINKFLSGDDSFKNEYHVSLAVNVLLLINSWVRLQNKSADKIEKIVKEESSKLKKEYFPFLFNHDFIDKEQKVIKQIKNNYVTKKRRVYKINYKNRYYLKLRKKILYGKITNKDDEKLTKGIYHINKREVNDEIKIKINNFIKSESSCYDLKTDEAICELCENQEICLKRYLN